MGIKLHDFGEIPAEGAHGPGHVYVFLCPGCECGHLFTVGPNGWTWNGSMEKPTFTPSLLCNQDMPESRCHSFVRDGMIQFLGDCYHKLAGQTVEIPDWDDDKFS
jgi:hypothetical protein